MRVEIYGDAKRKTVSGPTVQFTADDAAPVNDLKAQITPSIAGHSSVTITANGQNTSVPLTKPVYGGSVDVTTGVVTETHGGGAYNPTEVPTDLSSKIVSATTVKSASGSGASFNCTLGEYPMSALTAAINPVQDLHGYDHPWPGGGGKNKDQFYAEYDRGSSVAPSSPRTYADGILSISGTVDARNTLFYSQNITPVMASLGTATFSLKIFTGNLTNLEFRINVTETGQATERYAFGTSGVTLVYNSSKTYTLYGFISIDATVGGSVNLTTGIQIEAGSTKTEWTPYSNICPISGWTWANIHVSPTTDAADGETYSITFPSSAGTVYGGTLDVVNGVLTVDRATVTLNGSEALGAGTPISKQGCYTTLHSLKKLTDYKSAISCNELKTYAYHNAQEYLDAECGISGYRDLPNRFPGQNWLYIKINGLSTTDEYKTWLASNNLQVVYLLATPLTYTLTPQQIATILGQNNVWADTGDVTVSYRDGLLSNVSGIMTNSTALTAGENITYTLSQERTFQIPGTVIRTVVGKNVMSASTGNISVTWSSHWFDITPWIAYQGLTFSRNDVDSPDAGRDMSGYMHRGRVGVKEKMNVTTVQLTRAQSSTLQTLLYPETIQVRVTPYPRTNTSHTMSMYTNNVKTTYVIHRENGEDLQSLTFPLIEN